MTAVDVVSAGLHGADLMRALPSWAGVDRSRQIGVAERDEVTWAQADERTRAIASKLGTLRGALGVVTDLVNDISEAVERAWADRYDQVLGYASFEAFCAERFGDLGVVRLPAPERAQLVLSLTGAVTDEPRCSIRGAARLMSVSDQTARADIAKALPRPRALVAAAAMTSIDNVVELNASRDKSVHTSVTVQVLDALHAAGPAGLTIPECVAVVGRSYGSVSGALSAVEADGHAAREGAARGTFRPYVLAGFVGGAL